MIKLRYLDANCLVKLVIEEDGSGQLRKHVFQGGMICASSTFCFYEALGVLKSKWVGKKRPDNISAEEYFAACEDLCAMVEDGNIQLDEVSLAGRATFNEAEKIAITHQIDLSDALQLVTLKRGILARLNVGEPALVSEDEKLRKAADAQELQAFSIASFGG